MRRRGFLLGSLALPAVVHGSGAARAAEVLPIFDAHIHYSHDAWEVTPPRQAVAILRQAGLKRALVSSSNDDGNQMLLAEAPDDVRFHISRGAGESFANTLPLLHPRGFLQVQDIFVSEMDDYRKGFKGPGKLDGSLVTWVNGALLRAVGARAGYDVHFAPFPYRPGTKTSIHYTTQRD